MSVTARDELLQELQRLEHTRYLLDDRLRRVLTALALTLDAQRALQERLGFVDADVRANEADLGPLELSAARCRQIVKSLKSA